MDSRNDRHIIRDKFPIWNRNRQSIDGKFQDPTISIDMMVV